MPKSLGKIHKQGTSLEVIVTKKRKDEYLRKESCKQISEKNKGQETHLHLYLLYMGIQ